MLKKFKVKIRRAFFNNKIGKKFYYTIARLKSFFFSYLSDEYYAKLRYKENTGKRLNLTNPTTYNEKLWWLNLNNRDPLLTRCSDKHAVREYVEECGLGHILIETYGVYKSAEDVEFEKIPEKSIIKCTHGSGTNILYEKNKNFNYDEFEKKFNLALKTNYYKKSREWNYKNIEPQLIVEKLLEIDSNDALLDYRFLCFNGEFKLLMLDIDTMASDGSHAPGAKRNLYDREFNHINMKIGRKNYDSNLVSKPENFEKMIEYAELLSQPFEHCRVDLYNVKGQIFFGEITFYPGGAIQHVEPLEWDVKLGSWINIDSHKIKKIKNLNKFNF